METWYSLEDENGQVATTRLDETTLEKISQATGGTYYRSTLGDLELDRLVETIQAGAKDFILKSFTEKRILNVLRKVLTLQVTSRT